MSKQLRRIVCITLIILTLLSFVGCSDSKTITSKIESLEWQAIAEIQELRPCDESGWEVPEGAMVYKEQEEIQSYTIVGYETKYRTEEYQELVGYYRPTWRPRYETRTRVVSYREAIKEPVYATKYYYTIDRWVFSKNIMLYRGDDPNYDYSDYVCAENERVADVNHTYLVKLECDDDHVAHVVDKETWESLQVGQEVYGEIDQYGRISVDWANIDNVNGQIGGKESE